MVGRRGEVEVGGGGGEEVGGMWDWRRWEVIGGGGNGQKTTGKRAKDNR